jgi:hypothetical protein
MTMVCLVTLLRRVSDDRSDCERQRLTDNQYSGAIAWCSLACRSHASLLAAPVLIRRSWVRAPGGPLFIKVLRSGVSPGGRAFSGVEIVGVRRPLNRPGFDGGSLVE